MTKSLSLSEHTVEKLSLPDNWPPTLAVVIDTEEEFDWNSPFSSDERQTENIQRQNIAQAIMNRHHIVPTYVVDYPVADTADASNYLRSIADAGECEIGAHLHPWVCPPYGEAVNNFNSFPGNLPAGQERDKLAKLTDRIERAFGRRPIIYKAGRYGIGPSTFGTLRELGFDIDVSVVPHTDFSDKSGPNFVGFPTGPFRLHNSITELPLSVHFVGALAGIGSSLFPALLTTIAKRIRAEGIASKSALLGRLRLSPEGHTLHEMVQQTRVALARGERYFMLTYHSSSLLPGANGYVRDDIELEKFLAKLDGYFSFFLDDCHGQAKKVSDIASSLCVC